MRQIILPICLLIALLAGARHVIWKGEGELHELRRQYDAETARLRQANQMTVKEEIASHQRDLADEELISGELARQKHEKEWASRCAYKPSFAETTREKTILAISSISEDRTLPVGEILWKIASLSAPDSSVVEVNPTPNGFHVVVTFDMSVMTHGEQGSNTKHFTIASLKDEVIEIMARVYKDLYDHCGSSGIDRISVACTHGVEQSSLGDSWISPRGRNSTTGLSIGSYTTTMIIYQCAIPGDESRQIPDWHNVALYKVADLFTVERDAFPQLRIKTRTFPRIG